MSIIAQSMWLQGITSSRMQTNLARIHLSRIVAKWYIWTRWKETIQGIKAKANFHHHQYFRMRTSGQRLMMVVQLLGRGLSKTISFGMEWHMVSEEKFNIFRHLNTPKPAKRVKYSLGLNRTHSRSTRLNGITIPHSKQDDLENKPIQEPKGKFH